MSIHPWNHSRKHDLSWIQNSKKGNIGRRKYVISIYWSRVGVGVYFLCGGNLQPCKCLSYFLCATTRDFWIIWSFLMWNYVLRIGHILCVVTNCGSVTQSSLIFISSLCLAGRQHYRKILSRSLDSFSIFILFQVAFLIFFFVLSLSFLITFFWLGIYCVMKLNFTPGN